MAGNTRDEECGRRRPVENGVAAASAAGAAGPGRSALATIGRLERALSLDGAQRTLPPVERWNPPYCGDIGLAIAADGTWSYGGSPIRREPLVKLFASVLRRDADGQHYLVTPVEKVLVRVADAPFLAVDMDVVDDGGGNGVPVIVVSTNIGDVVRIGRANPLRFEVEASSGGLKPYVTVRGRLEARFTRSLAYDLVQLAVPFDAGMPGAAALSISSGGVSFPLPPGELW